MNVRHQLNAEKDVDICRICVMREMIVPTLLEKTIFKRLVRLVARSSGPHSSLALARTSLHFTDPPATIAA